MEDLFKDMLSDYNQITENDFDLALNASYFDEEGIFVCESQVPGVEEDFDAAVGTIGEALVREMEQA